MSSLLAQVVAVARKDVLIEWRGRARINAVAFFGVTTLVLFSFAIGPDPISQTAHAGAYLWLALMLASVLALGESFRVETENEALEGLRLLPVHPMALFLGKALVNAAVLLGLSVSLLPLTAVLYSARLEENGATLLLVLTLGALGVAAPGTLYAAVASRARAREVLLPLLLFPLIIPVLMGAVKATTLLMLGDVMTQVGSWLRLLAAFDIIYWTLCALLFARVIED